MHHAPDSRPERQYPVDEAQALADFPIGRAELRPNTRLHLAGHSWRSSTHDSVTTWHWIDAAYKAGTEPTDRPILWVRTWVGEGAGLPGSIRLRELATTHLRDVVLARSHPTGIRRGR